MSTSSCLNFSSEKSLIDSAGAQEGSVSLKMGIPRLAEIMIALVGLVVFAPAILAAIAAVALTSRGPAIFRQKRVGRGGQTFVLYKLRTMKPACDGPQVTSTDDQRITSVGRFLRKTKLDELPELWNVLRGDMSLVGPRPEVPRYVDLANPKWAFVLRSKPGITDPVTMRLRNEEELLQNVEGDLELFYVNVLQPLKLKGYLEYLRTRTWWNDVKVLWWSAVAVVRPGTVARLTVQDVMAEVSQPVPITNHPILATGDQSNA